MAPKTVATPGRVTRSQTREPGPQPHLPPVAPKASQAYGSTGKTELQHQMRATSNDFADEFGGTRRRRETTAVPEETEDEAKMSPSPLPQPKRKSRLQALRQQAVASSSDHDEDSSRPNTAMMSSLLYGPDDPAPQDPQPPRQRQPSRQLQTPRNDPDRSPIDDHSASPSSERHHSPWRQASSSQQQEIRPSPLRNQTRQHSLSPVAMAEQYAPTNFRLVVIPALVALIFLLFLIAFVSVIPVPASLVTYRQKLTDEWVVGADPSKWNAVKQVIFNRQLLDRVVSLEKSVEGLKTRMDLHDDGMQALKDILPDSLVVRRVDGNWQIPTDFWSAMTEKMGTEDGAPLWDAFLTTNEGRLQNIMRQFSDSVKSDESASTSHDAIPREIFLRLIDENNVHMKDNFGDLLRDAQQTILTRAMAIAQNTSRETVRNSPEFRVAGLQAASLGYANYLHNAQQAVQSTNWFSVGLGARVVPQLTSPTMNTNAPSLVPWLFSKLSGYPKMLPPIAALQDWREAGQCWCASRSMSGAAQITILSPEAIYPETLVIEHPPPTGTMDIAAAPRQVDIWAEVPSADHAKRINTAIKANVSPTDFNQCGSAPASNYVCIGAGTYDIHFHNWVQTIEMFVDTKDLGLGVDKITVRARSNWGQKWTCLYRLRMTGDRVFIKAPNQSGK